MVVCDVILGRGGSGGGRSGDVTAPDGQGPGAGIKPGLGGL